MYLHGCLRKAPTSRVSLLVGDLTSLSFEKIGELPVRIFEVESAWNIGGFWQESANSGRIWGGDGILKSYA